MSVPLDDIEEVKEVNNDTELNFILNEDNNKNKDKNKKFFINITPQLNRGIIYTFHVSKYPILVGISYSKSSNMVQFQIDTELSPIKERKVNILMFRRLEDSIFRKVFLQMSRNQENDIDYKYNFLGIKSVFSNRIIQILNEKYILNANMKNNNDKKNEIEFMAWKFQDVDNDFIFLLVQRKFYNKITRIHTIRSHAIQLFTERGNDILEKYYKEFEKINDKENIDFDVV